MKTGPIDKEIKMVISSFDRSLIPDDLAKADDFYNYMHEKGMLKKKESQLFPNEAYSFRSQSGQIQ